MSSLFEKRILLFSFFLSCLFKGGGFLLAQEPQLPTRWTRAALDDSIPLSEYPRPQLQRSEWMCLNGEWDYIGGKNATDAADPVSPLSFDGKMEKIKVPYCPESVLSGVRRKEEINMWYRRLVGIPANWVHKQVIIHFEAAAHHTTLFVNGHKVGTHEGNYDAFSFNITSYLKKGKNSLMVAVKDLNDGRVPSGKSQSCTFAISPFPFLQPSLEI